MSTEDPAEVAREGRRRFVTNFPFNVDSVGPDLSDLSRVAVHEAGHCVLAAHGGLPFRSLHILPKEVGRDGDETLIYAGEFELVLPPGDLPALGRVFPDDVGPMFVAGFCAEQRFFGNHSRKSWQGDLQGLRRAYGWIEEMPVDGWDRLSHFVAEAWDRIDRYAEDIRVVAGALLELPPLTPSDIRFLIGHEFRDEGDLR